MLRSFEKILIILTVVLLLLLTGVVSIQVISRLMNNTLVWTEELTRITLIYLSYLGAAYAYYKGDGLRITMLTDRFSPRWRKINDMAINIFSLFVLGVVVYTGVLLAVDLWSSETSALEWNRGLLFLVLPTGVLLIFIKILKSIIDSFSKWGET